MMNKCTFCGRESSVYNIKHVEGYAILECCTDCEKDILREKAADNDE